MKKKQKLFKELPFYKALIEKTYIKPLNNIDMLPELSFYDELNIVKTSKAFKRYARSYSMETINSKDSSVQLTICKRFVKVLLNEIKGFKYQITLKALVSKYKEIQTEFAPVYFNSTTKTVFDPKYSVNKSFQEVFNKIDNWISE